MVPTVPYCTQLGGRHARALVQHMHCDGCRGQGAFIDAVNSNVVIAHSATEISKQRGYSFV